MKYFLIALLFVCCNTATTVSDKQNIYNEKHRPQIHFSPEVLETFWLNVFFLKTDRSK